MTFSVGPWSKAIKAQLIGKDLSTISLKAGNKTKPAKRFYELGASNNSKYCIFFCCADFTTLPMMSPVVPNVRASFFPQALRLDLEKGFHLPVGGLDSRKGDIRQLAQDLVVEAQNAPATATPAPVTPAWGTQGRPFFSWCFQRLDQQIIGMSAESASMKTRETRSM